MEIKYNKVNQCNANNYTSEKINTSLFLKFNANPELDSVKGILKLKIHFTDNDVDKVTNQILSYARFDNCYTILSTQRTTISLHFGFTKIKGTLLFLIAEDNFENEIKNSSVETFFIYHKLLKENSHTHVAFIADNFKRFILEEEFKNHNNKKISIVNPVEIIDQIKLKDLKNE